MDLGNKVKNLVKKRIDIWLVEQGHFQSREQARRAIMAGEILVNGKRIEKAGQLVAVDPLIPVAVSISGNNQCYVSRGGYKLEKALRVFQMNINGKVCLDAGASTGGFTDCLLKAGAAHVYAVDVGYGQLAWKLRQDNRVTVFERENIRYFPVIRLERKPELITADLSFISLKLVFPKFRELITDRGSMITLIKPQFEVGKGKVGKKGVVRDKTAHLEVLERLAGESAGMGWSLQDLTFSPILGPEGNIEYLGYWLPAGNEEREPKSQSAVGLDICQVIDKAWMELTGGK
jgi:23S rRNA (cytidine1920-2'-O)/16S rRNA (cytidine1409-2'-O)-methyltransferase